MVGFALCISDGNADLPQHLLVDLADRCSQRPDGCRSIEIKDRHEIFVVEVAFRFQSTAGHQSISDTDGGCCLELYSDVKLIIFLQKGTVNDIEEVLLMLRPVFLEFLLVPWRSILEHHSTQHTSRNHSSTPTRECGVSSVPY